MKSTVDEHPTRLTDPMAATIADHEESDQTQSSWYKSSSTLKFHQYSVHANEEKRSFHRYLRVDFTHELSSNNKKSVP